jgi:uncharacterized membrane protein YdbT with pleckstrin-like domain
MNYNNIYINPDVHVLKPTVFYTFLKLLSLIFLMAGVWFGFEFIPGKDLYRDIILGTIFLIYVYRFFYIQSFTYKFEADLIIITYGVFSTSTNYIELFKVKAFDQYQSFLMRIIGVMRVNIYSSDLIKKHIDISGIPSSNFLIELRRLVNKSRANNNVYEVD